MIDVGWGLKKLQIQTNIIIDSDMNLENRA